MGPRDVGNNDRRCRRKDWREPVYVCADGRVGTARLSDDVREIAAGERRALGVDSGVQLKWRDEREAFRAWRAAVERRNVLVFQLHMPIEDARGFSLSDGGPFAIAVSSSDV